MRAPSRSGPQSSAARRRAALFVFCSFLFAAAFSGCASTQIVRSDGSAQWSGLDARLTLPQGVWRVRSSEKDGVASFTIAGRPGNLALFRVKTEPGAPNWLALKKLFADFPDKHETSSGRTALPDGRTEEWAEYDVKTEGRTTQVKAYSLRFLAETAGRPGGWTYELAEWNFKAEAPGEKILAGLQFTK